MPPLVLLTFFFFSFYKFFFLQFANHDVYKQVVILFCRYFNSTLYNFSRQFWSNDFDHDCIKVLQFTFINNIYCIDFVETFIICIVLHNSTILSECSKTFENLIYSLSVVTSTIFCMTRWRWTLMTNLSDQNFQILILKIYQRIINFNKSL